MKRRVRRLARQPRVLLAFLLLALGAASSPPARAVPPDELRTLKPGASLIEKAPFGEIAKASAVEVDDPGLVSAELLPAGEVLIEAKAPGVAHVFFFGRRAVWVLQISVVRRSAAGVASPSTQAPSTPSWEPESPGSMARPRPAPRDPDATLAVADEATYLRAAEAAGAAGTADVAGGAAGTAAGEALRGRVAMPRYRFELAGLQAEAKAAQALLAKAGLPWVRASFSPFGVKLAGARDEAERRRAVVVLYTAVLGRLRLAE